MAEKCLPGEPEQDSRVFSDTPEHGEVLEFVERLAHDVNALVFQFG
jgi:hypothetical protein